MLGVKLTILCFILVVVLAFFTRVSECFMSEKEQLRIRLLGKGPKWWEFLCMLIGLLAIADIIGLLYSAVWLLFFR